MSSMKSYCVMIVLIRGPKLLPADGPMADVRLEPCADCVWWDVAPELCSGLCGDGLQVIRHKAYLA